MEFVGIFLFVGGCFLVFGAVHETGHFLAGWAARIPASEMRIRLFTIPGHVVLRAGDRWVSPREHDLFVQTQWRHLVTRPRVYLFVAGGMLVETLFATLLTVQLAQFGWPNAALAAVAVSLAIFLPYLVVDPIMAWRSGHACGDFSGLWLLAKLPTALLVAAMLSIRLFLVWYAVA